MRTIKLHLLAERDASVELPFELDGSGRIVGHCPEGTDSPGNYCWKFENPDPSSQYDFWLMLFVVRTESIGVLNMLVPLEDGGLEHFVQY